MIKGRIKTAIPPRDFLADVVAANKLHVRAILPEIACQAAYHADFIHGDPADRIIAATALHHKARLLTCDIRLREMKSVKTAW